MTQMRVWVDGALVASDRPAIRPDDHGVTVGDGAFETCKIVDGRPFALTRHLRRMDRTLAGLGLPPADHAFLREGVDAVLASGPGIPFGRLRWTVTAGSGPLGSDRHDSPLTHIVSASPVAAPPESMAVVTVPWTRNERAATAGLKTTSYAENVVALAAAKRQGAGEAIFANTRGELCEGTGSNVFVVIDSLVYTPPLESGCLAGITRELVLEWCGAEGRPVREATLPLDVLDSCDEVFLTSSLKDVMPVHAVDERVLTPGPLSLAVRGLWRRAERERPDP